MPKRKETKRTKTKTTRIVKSAIAKGKGIAQNQSVVVNIQEKKKRTYKRKPKISATSQVAQPAFNYSGPLTSAMNTTMFQQPLSNIVPPPPEFRNQVIPAPMRQSINNNVTEQPFGGQFNYPMLPPPSRTNDNDDISLITIPPNLFDVANRSNNFINSLQGIDEDDFDDSDSSSKEKSIRVRRIIRVKRNPPVEEEVAIPQPPAERRVRRTKEEMVAVKEENRIRAMIKAGERELQLRRDNPQPKKVKKKPFIV